MLGEVMDQIVLTAQDLQVMYINMLKERQYLEYLTNKLNMELSFQEAITYQEIYYILQLLEQEIQVMLGFM